MTARNTEMTRMNSQKKKKPVLGTTFVLCCSLLSAGTASAADNLSWNLSIDGRYDDNIGLAPDDKSKRDTKTTSVSGGLAWLVQQSATRDISLSATPFYNYVETLEDLTNYGVTFGFAGEQRFNESFTAPFVAVELTGTWQEYEASEIRDGYVLTAEIALGKQFNPYVGARIGGRFRLQEATEDDPIGSLLNRNSDEVNDLQSAGGFIKFDFNPLPKTSIFVEYSYMTGDVAATGNGLAFNNPAAFDSARDFAFEEGVDFLSWRIDADQNIYALGLSQAITDKLQLDATASYLDADGEFNNDYDNEIFTLGFTWNF